MTVERAARVALAAAPGFGPRRIAHLLATFGTAAECLAAPRALLQSRAGLSTAAWTRGGGLRRPDVPSGLRAG